MKKTLKRVLILLLVLVTFTGILAEAAPHASAASYTYKQTAKSDVPIWSAASSSSTKIRTISAVGTVLKVVGQTTNSSGNLWYKLHDGYWVFSGNVTSHSHAYTGGICTGRDCGYEYPYTVVAVNATGVVTNGDGAKIWSRPYSNNSTHVRTEPYGKVLTVVGATQNADGNLWYKLSDGRWVFSGNVTQRFTIYYNYNGGINGPGTQYVLKGSKLTISSTKPTRVGYTFQGWGTSSSDTSVDYKPGTAYSFTSDKTLYAIWKACSHSYTGGICNTCGYEYPYKVTSVNATGVVTNTDGAKIWSRPYSNNSTHIRTEAYGKVLTVVGATQNAEGNVWYKLSDGRWVFSGNVTQRFTISFNLNGGANGPGAKYVLKGSKLTIPSTKPTRVGYTFQGWGTSSSDTSVDYKPGTAYSFTSDKTLYAIWKKCSHSYSGGICDTCGYEYPYSVTSMSRSFQVTNADGASYYNRPYSSKSTKFGVKAKGTVLTIVAKTTNQAGNLWYKTSDGYWLYSGNVTERVTITYNANGGKNTPDAKTVLKGSQVTLPSTKPTRVGYVLKGWYTAKSVPSGTAYFKAGGKVTVNGDGTLYAVWGECSHSYSGGICTVCNYEYPITVTSLSTRYFQVTNSDGASVYNRPYSNNSTKLRVEKKGAVLTIVAKVTNKSGNLWYQLSDGGWVYSGNITQRFSVEYSANGGKNAPATQYFLKDKKLTLSSDKPSRPGYVFQGWGTTASDTSVDYKPGASYSTNKSITLHAIWKTCSHSKYSGGICSACGYEYPLTISDHSAYYVVTNADGAKLWSRPYSSNSTHVSTASKGTALTVAKKTVNQSGNTWYQLTNGNWVYSGNVSRAYKLTYNANGGKNAPSAVIKAANTKFNLSSSKPTRDGYIFLGWSTSSTGSANYKPGASVSLGGNATLYAIWDKCVTITANPSSQILKAGDTAVFSVGASGSGLNYQWQYRTSSSANWVTSGATGATTKSISVSATTERNGYQYRCMITDKYGNTVYSSTAYLYTLGVTSQPSRQCLEVGDTAEFRVSATGYKKSYQWQYKTSSSGSWKNCSSEGNQSRVLNINATTGRSGYYFRCKITDGAGNVVYSNSARLYVLGITSQPSSQNVDRGEMAVFSVTATGYSKSYQWQYRTSSSDSWKNCSSEGNDTASMSIKATSARDGYQFRCKITDGVGNVVYSNKAALFVE